MKKILLTGCTLALVFGAQVQANDAPLDGTLSKIASAKAITLGYRDASVPFSYVGDSSGKPMGYSVELANKIVERIQQKTGVANLNVKYNLVTSQTRIPLIQNGTADVECGSTTNNAERAQQVDFTVNIFEIGTRLLVKKDKDGKPSYADFADLKGKNVVTTAGTTSERIIKAMNADKQMGMNVISAKDHGESFQMLESGRAVAFMMDDALLAGEEAKAKKPDDWVITGTPQSFEAYACMVRKDDPAFKKAVDDAIVALYKSGEINKIYSKWFESPIPPKGLNLNFPMSEKVKELIANPSDKPAPDVKI